ncbi:MAG TPA: CBS domain-containing protein [Sedimentisphaerales bacterium]|nr:CBS domain-containing protein [Sedimentisphaerales bacterium]
MDKLTAKDVMQYGVVSVEKTDPVHRAVSLLLDKGISGLPVTDCGKLVGMISERDLLRLAQKEEYLPGQVADYMTSEVVSVDVDDPLSSVSLRLVNTPFRRVPVLLHQRTLAGIISRADLIRVYREKLCPPRPKSGTALLSEDAMRPGLLTVFPDAPISEAMDLIVRRHITGLPVVDEQMILLGIITEKDLLNYCLHPFPPDATVSVFMTTKVVAFDRKADLDLICECLIEKDFHRVPIVDQGRLVGIISRSDILRSRVAAFRR